VAENSSKGTFILIGLIGGAVLVAGGVVAAVMFMCFGVAWVTAPGPEIASIDVQPGVPFTLMTPTSHETARSVFLEFVVDHENTNPWAVEGWVEIDGIEFEIDLQPGADGVKGYPADWEEDVDIEESHIWSSISGEILLGSLPPVAEEGGERKVDGQVWGLHGTEIASLRVYARE